MIIGFSSRTTKAKKGTFLKGLIFSWILRRKLGGKHKNPALMRDPHFPLMFIN